ncbi:putative membrane-anchored cell surface protein [uncultured Mediterranean phage]|nr:putative membrane-anchored cell surface protein [uncultured Mediterranean phage]
MSKISTWSTTADDNNSAVPNGWAESMLPSGVNNTAREGMAQTRVVWNDKEWFEVGDGDGATVVTRTSNTTVTIPTDVTATHHVSRRVKIFGTNSGTYYTHISISSYSAPNTTLTFASGTISSSDSTISLYLGSPYVNPAIPVVDEDNMVSNSAVLPPSQQSVKAYADSGTQTITNKTINLTNNTLTGTTAQFNTALSDNDFTTLAGAETLTNKTLTSPILNTGISGTAFKDEDNMASDSATAVASQQSIKKFVEDQLTAEDLDVSDGTTAIAIDLDSETLGLLGGTGITSTALGNNVTFAIDGTVVTESSTDTLTNKTINASNNTLSNIANGSLSNSTVSYGGVSLALGSVDATPAFNLADATGYPGSAISGTIGNSQIATGVDSAKIADGTVSNTEFQYINSLSSNAQTQITARLEKASNLSDLVSASTSRTNLGLGTIATQAASNVAVTGGSITGLGSPSASSDAATKNYVDEAVAGLRTRVIAECASTANVNLTNGLEAGDSIDGVVLVAGDRCLIKSQTDATENGLYLAVASGAASRDPEYDTIAEISGSLIVVNQGSTNNDTIWLCTTDSSGSIGSTSITYTKVTPSNTGTVTSIGLAQSGTEFTISGSPVTSSGNITVDVNRIAATKIGADTSVSNTEYGYLANVSSDIQTQLDAKATAGFSVAMAIAL